MTQKCTFLCDIYGCDHSDEPAEINDRDEKLSALEAENKRLREVLEYIVECYESDDETGYVASNMYEAAKAALAEEGGGRV